MATSQQVVRVHVSDRACRSNVHIATRKNGADGGAGLERLRLLYVTDGTSAHHGNDSCTRKLRSKLLEGLLRETAEHKRRFDRLQIIREISQASRSSGRSGLARTYRFGSHGSISWSLIQCIDFQHLADRRYPGNRFLGECSDAKSECSREFSVKINRAATHAGDYSGVFNLFADQADKNDVALRAVGVL